MSSTRLIALNQTEAVHVSKAIALVRSIADTGREPSGWMMTDQERIRWILYVIRESRLLADQFVHNDLTLRLQKVI